MKVVEKGMTIETLNFPRRVECKTCGSILEVSIDDLKCVIYDDQRDPYFEGARFQCPECNTQDYIKGIPHYILMKLPMAK